MGINFKEGKQRCAIIEDDFGNISKGLKNEIDKLSDDRKKKNYGVMHTKKTEAVPIFNIAECETTVPAVNSFNNCEIVFGRDRPAQIGSGYGGLGADHSAMIDIVVGRAGMQARRTVGGGDTPLVVDNDFVKDAARIYISERTDLDSNFGIVPGRQGNPTGRSGIGIKADNVRIIGRESIKLITRTDAKNSKDGNTDVVMGIDLIAGDDDSDLQPIVKGNNLRQLLLYMVDDLLRLTQMVHALSLSNASLESMLMAHTHLVNGAPSIELGLYCGFSQARRLIQDIPSHLLQTLNNITEEIEFLRPYGGRYINSKKNNVN